MKIDPYHQRQKRRPMTLVSGNIRCMWIFAGVPLGGASNYCAVGDDGNFLIYVDTSSETLEIRPAILCGDMLPLSACNRFQNEWPRRTTLRGYFMSNWVFVPALQTQRVRISKTIARKVINIDL